MRPEALARRAIDVAIELREELLGLEHAGGRPAEHDVDRRVARRDARLGEGLSRGDDRHRIRPRAVSGRRSLAVGSLERPRWKPRGDVRLRPGDREELEVADAALA